MRASIVRLLSMPASSPVLQNPVPNSPQNIKYVSSLYRRSLRTASDWVNKREIYRYKMVEIREKFEKNRGVEDPQKLRQILFHTEGLLEDLAHPDPIIPPGRPGGTKYDRNVPPREGRPVNYSEFFV